MKRNWRYKFKIGDSNEKYECPHCHAVLELKYSPVYIVVFIFIGIPVISFLVDFLTAITLYPSFGHIDILGIKLLSIISNGLIILIIISILYKSNEYKVVSYDRKP